jgi:hypothetical protein
MQVSENTMDCESKLKITVLECFDSLISLLIELSKGIKSDANFVAWIQEDDFPIASKYPSSDVRMRAIEIYNQCHYQNNQAPREIIVCAGFIGSSEDTIQIANQVNIAKDNFKQSIIALRKANISPKDNWLVEQLENKLHKRSDQTQQTLSNMGLSRLHLKQCYRKIPILKLNPKKISWTWAHTKAIKRITAKDAFDLLAKKSSQPGIQLQIAKLAQIPQSEPLAIVQELAPHLRANVVYKTYNHETERKMIKGPVPILFPADTATPWPEFKPPNKKQQRDTNRVTRSDVKIESESFLPAIRAHRYKILSPTD